VNTLCELVVDLAEFQSSGELRDLNMILSTCPGISSQNGISYNSIKVASKMHDGCTLVGMNKVEYVDEVLKIDNDHIDMNVLDGILSGPHFQ
jgi:hypothetical protein